MALLLGTRHDHELMATRQQGPQLNRLLIWHRTWFGTDGFGEVGDVGGVDREVTKAMHCTPKLRH